ncbi:MAG TPA: hypothetical protein VHW64_19535 [Nocardioides sp.]|uniref:hypothetical protein n=1 Tax=Nocardioides sp. TaxID=35761 RepID=UPI002E34F52C|nr:hypothetical protein [Nocardioides sp.]HEX3932888.1 hypothetical protein [Nocardioides sp.]
MSILIAGGILPEHGLGGAQDLPISRGLVILGAGAAVAVSFLVLALAWRTPRYDAATSGRPAPPWLASLVDSAGWRGALRVLGLLALLYLVVTAVFGKDLLTNPIFGIFYVWIWVGMVPASLLLGRVWRAISPFRLINAGIARLSGSEPGDGMLAYPERLGMWPASLGLLAFVWMELVYPHNVDLSPVRLWCAIYLGLMIAGGAVFGSTFYARADPFEVYSTLVASASVWGRRDGALVIRSPLANLDATPATPGLVGVVAVLFGSTAFDAFRDSTRWLTFIQGTGYSPYLQNNLGLLGFCVAVGLIFWLACVATAVGPEHDRRALPGQLAVSVVPIIVGYVVAHYLSYVVEIGTQTLVLASDPLSNGSNIFGTGNLVVPYWLSYHPTFLADIKVLAVVVGHVVGVVVAHERAIKLLPKRHQLTGQLPLLAAMVCFTVGGLYLLFSS